MAKVIAKRVETEWRDRLVSDLRQLGFAGIVVTKHAIGKRFLKDWGKFGKPRYGNATVDGVAKDIGAERSDVYRCIQFARKYPELSTAVDNLSWREVRQKLLPAEQAHVSHATGENEWYTPAELIAAAHQVMGNIDCDPASSAIANRTVKAKIFYRAKDDGLKQTWGNRVWMNPPYAQPLVAQFAEALASKYESGEVGEACVLVNNATETGWFQRLLGVASSVCFIEGRVKFLDPEGNLGAPLQGQGVLYLGTDRAAFSKAFGEYGVVLSHD